MKINQLPPDLQKFILPQPRAGLLYECLSCRSRFPADSLLHDCPSCGGLLVLNHREMPRLKERPGQFWRDLFDYRLMINENALKGVFLYQEFLAPDIAPEDVIYLGEGRTPLVQSPFPVDGRPFFVKLEGLNPSLSFKDRGMAAALSFVKSLIRTKGLKDVICVCASTGDTSAAAALYAASLGGDVKSAVLLPRGYVTAQQLSQPLGYGAKVLELPGVFDDCMRVVEELAKNYQVALLNSKNPWRVLGQESYAYETAQQFDWDLAGKVLFAPVGNAGNITAILSGLLKLRQTGVLESLPKVVAVQSKHANPVYRYYRSIPQQRRYEPVRVKPSVAQAAMIGDPVSMPRLRRLASLYAELGGIFTAVEATETAIMESMLEANRGGLSVCTQGGVSLAGVKKALEQELLDDNEIPVINSTAHPLKFMEFQTRYFNGDLDAYGIETKPAFVNLPQALKPEGVKLPSAEDPLSPEEEKIYVKKAVREIAKLLELTPISEKD
ncbi:MAG: threonine synthase [Deltaproteobacteria bacterium]|jgi:threonine synthase|nr:threonine synthase [Deltaproteobacteria bacterium]